MIFLPNLVTARLMSMQVQWTTNMLK